MNISCFLECRVAWSSTYTYILLLFAAAAFIAYISRPRMRGEVVKRLFAGTLLDNSGIVPTCPAPYLHIHCFDHDKVVFERINVEGLTSSGAISIAATFNGKDIEIIERVTSGYVDDTPMTGASFTLDLTGFEWRHIKWSNEENGLWCAFSLHVRPGIDFNVELKH